MKTITFAVFSKINNIAENKQEKISISTVVLRTKNLAFSIEIGTFHEQKLHNR